MFETIVTIVGNVVTDPIRRRVGDQEVFKFRVASNSRRRTADGGWEAGNSLFVTVNCWGRLVTGVGASLYKGAPVVVVGHLYTSEYEDKEGVHRSSVEVRATSVGPDLSRCSAQVGKIVAAGPDTAAAAAVETGEPAPDDAAEADPRPDDGLPLSA